MTSSTTVSDLKINKLTKAQFENIESPSPTELYFVIDEGGEGGTVDQTYDPTSTNAQSGTAVAEALLTVSGGIFIAEYGVTSYQDIRDAYNNNKFIVCRYTDPTTQAVEEMYISGSESNYFTFASIPGNTTNVSPYIATTLTESGWSSISQYALERTSNKVTSITSSSTDTQYPSAKCVYDNIKLTQMIQDIQSITSGAITINKAKSIYLITPSSATTFSFTIPSSVVSTNQALTFELFVNLSTVYSLTFPSSVIWQDGETPDLSSTGRYFFAFRTVDRGSIWLGNLQGRW